MRVLHPAADFTLHNLNDRCYHTDMTHLLLVALGGAVGSVLRYLTGLLTLRVFGPGFPWRTLAVNIFGSLLIGIAAEVIGRKISASQEMRLLLITGFLGGFTTFSAFSLDIAFLFERGALASAGLYLAATMLVSLFAVFAGLAMARALL